MILLLTDDGPEKNGLKELVIGAVKEEFQTFRTEFSKTSLKLLVLNFGKDKTFFDQLANGTVRNDRYCIHKSRQTELRQTNKQSDK